MLPHALSERVDALIDDLIMDGGVDAASLGSILLASKDSLKGDYLVTLSRRVWLASSELKAGYALEQVRRSSLPAPTAENGVATRPFLSHRLRRRKHE
jgi:hypothetical protein